MDEFDEVEPAGFVPEKPRRAPAHLRDAEARQGLGELPGYSEPLQVVGADEGIASSRYYDEPRRSFGRVLLDILFILVAGLACFVLIRLFVGEAYKVPTGSMLETIQLDDLVWGEKLSFRFREPDTGDVVTFDDPKDSGQILIKRVIATEGQTIDLRDGLVYVDGQLLDEPYVNGRSTDPLTQWEGYEGEISYPFTVPEGMVWVMGDNRTSSADSRYFGPIERDSITSRAFGIYWPPKDIGLL